MKKYKVSLITLLCVFVMAISCLFASTFAFAERNITYTGTTIFYKTNGAAINAYGVEEDVENAEGAVSKDTNYYTLFLTHSEGDSLSYRKNLALYWNEVSGQGTFNMTFGFVDLSFGKYVIELQTQQYNDNKENVSKNYIVVMPATDADKVYVLQTTDKDAIKEMTAPEDSVAFSMNKITLTLQPREEGSKGDVKMLVSDGQTQSTLTLNNVGKNYSKYYSSSNSNPCTPLSFYSMFESTGKTAKFILYQLNGQSLKFQKSTIETGDLKEGEFPKAGTLTDDTAPVICFTSTPSLISYGKELNLEYVVIDVIASSPKATLYYYTLTNAQVANAEFNGNKMPLTKEDKVDADLYTEIKTSDNVLMLDVVDGYYPSASDVAYFGDKFTPHGLVKVLIALTDVTTTGGETGYVFLDWYVDAEKLVSVNGVNYLVLGKDEVGVTYTKYTDSGLVNKSAMQVAWDDYQKEIDKLVYGENGELLLKAGSSEYIYLPSAENLFSDNLTAYQDLTFTVYYKNDSQRSNSNLDSTNLCINTSTSGDYAFTFFATDEFGNPMYYIDKDGEVQEFKASEIWDFFDDKDGELEGLIPWFNFKVGYGVPKVETPGVQSVAYVGTTYTGINFDISGESGSYSTNYSLYLFNRAKYVEDNGSIDYNAFVSEKDGKTLLETLFENAESRGKYFTTITPLSELTAEEKDEKSDNYNKMAAYKWNGSSSFVPQDSNAFYVVRLEVTDNMYEQSIVKYMGINATKKATEVEGDRNWFKENVVTVVFASIGVAAMLGIIAVLIFMPKSKGDIDEITPAPKKKSKK